MQRNKKTYITQDVKDEVDRYCSINTNVIDTLDFIRGVMERLLMLEKRLEEKLGEK